MGAVMEAKELAVALIDRFGDGDAMVELLAEDVEWWVSPSIEVVPNLMVGRDVIRDAMRFVFGELYADVRTKLHAAVGEGDTAAVRITLTARALGRVDYENEYAFFVEARDGRIVRVWEYVDMQLVMKQLTSGD